MAKLIEKEQASMPEVLKGNFQTRNRVTAEQAKEGLTAQFEREALKRLGGSIAFVAKKQFLYGMSGEANKTETPKGS